MVVSLVIVSLSILYTVFNIDYINTTLKGTEWKELIINLFTIQATIATLSISIIAIITGFQSKSVCGITVTHYVTSLKPCILKHKVLMIADLILTGVNYFLVAFNLDNVSISLFIISIIISCVLIIDTSFVFKKSNAIEEEICNFVLENCTDDFIADLGSSVNANAAAENVNELEFELSFITTLFQNELMKNVGKTKTLDKIESILINCFLSNYLSNNKEMVLSILNAINNIYVSANSKANGPYPIDIWSSIYPQYMTFIGTVSMPQIKNKLKFDCLAFRYQIQKNIVFEDKDGQQVQTNNFMIEYYYVMVYQKMLSNNLVSKDELERFKEAVLDDAYTDAFWKTADSNQKDIDIKGLCYLLKSLIEDGEIKLLNSHFLQKIKYTLNNPLEAFTFLVSLIYAYYLAYNEPYVNNKAEQENALGYLKLLSGARPCINLYNSLYYIKLIEVLEKTPLNLFSLMRSWEKYKNGVVKTIRLEPTINECLFFISIAKYHDEEKLATCFRLITENQVQTLIMDYYSDNCAFEDRFVLFNKRMFNRDIAKEDRTVKEIKSLVRGALAREYKIELNEQAKGQPINDQMIQDFKEQLIMCFTEQKKKFEVFDHETDNVRTRNKQIRLPFIDYYDLTNEVNEYYKEKISEIIVDSFFECFYSNINTRKINYKSKDKQDTLINLSQKIYPDTFIGNRETFWEEDDKDKLMRFTENMYKIDNPNSYNELYLLNSQRIYFTIRNVSFDICDCSVDDFYRLGVEKQGDVFLYSRLANIMKIPYSKEELLSHLKQTRKRLVMSFDVCSAVKEETAGCGIIISYSDNEESDKTDENTTDDIDVKSGSKHNTNITEKAKIFKPTMKNHKKNKQHKLSAVVKFFKKLRCCK